MHPGADTKAVRTKFVCEGRTENIDGTLTIHLKPVWDQDMIRENIENIGKGTAATDNENLMLWTRHPNNLIDFNISNPEAFGLFVLGATYYLDVKLAEMPNEAIQQQLVASGIGGGSPGYRTG